MKDNIGRMIAIDWIDSSSDSGWKNTEDCKAVLLECQTIGYLVDDNDKAIAVAQNRTLIEEYRPWGEIMHIPKICIRKKRFLK